MKPERLGYLLSPSAATKAVVSLAADDFPEFLSITERMFQAAIEQVECADGAGDDDLDALEKAMAELVSLQVPFVLPADAKAAASSTLAT